MGSSPISRTRNESLLPVGERFFFSPESVPLSTKLDFISEADFIDYFEIL